MAKYLKRGGKLFSGKFPRSNLCLSPEEFRVGMHGTSGGVISTNKTGYPLRKNLFHVINAHPDIVFVDIGSNNMCDEEVTPAKLAGDIMKLARFFVEGCDVKIVVIGALLPRRNPDLAVGYNRRVSETNALLQSRTADEERIMFCYHAWFDNPLPGVYCKDGVHLSYTKGYERYSRSIRGAILRARGKARHLGLL